MVPHMVQVPSPCRKRKRASAGSSAGVGLFVRCRQRLLRPCSTRAGNYGPPIFEVGGFVQLAGSAVEKPHGLHWNTFNSSTNVRLIIVRNVISRPQTGQMTSFAGVTFSFICIDRCDGSSGYDMDQSSSGEALPQHRE